MTILAAALAVLLSGGAYAATPGLISYQGTLRKDGRLFSGTVPMEFKITDASGATEYWSSGSTDVVVSTGLFRYPLGTPDEETFADIPWKDITPYVRMSLDGGWLAPEPLYSSVYSLHSVTAEASTGTFTVNDGDLKLAGPAGSRGIVYTDNTVQRTAPGWAASGQHAVLTGTGYAGLGLAGPQTRLDVQAAAADPYSQFWRNSGGVIVASMSAAGTLYADAAGLRNIAGDGLGSHLATQDLNMAGRRIVSAPSLGLNAAVSLSSSAAAQHGGLYVSSHVYLAAGARYYGDGSGLTGVSGSDDLGNHTLSQNLVLGAKWVSGDGGDEGLAVDTAGNVGVGQAAPGARLDVRGDAGGYAQIWRDSGGIVQASMSATGVLYAAASGLRGLPSGAAGDGLGNHTLGQNLTAGTFWYSGDGGNEGLFVDGGGNAGVGTNAPAARLDVRGAVTGNSQIWRSAAGAAVATMTAAGVLHADGSGLRNIAEADPVFAAHPANAILAGERDSWNNAVAWGDHAVAGYAALAQANTFASSATFAAQHATLPGVLVSSGLVVANGSVGIGTALPLQRLDVNGAVRVGDSLAGVPGSIRYNGGSFQGYGGSGWVELNGSYVFDSSSLWAVAGNSVYTVDAASSVAIGWSNAGNSKLLVRGNTDGVTENAFLAENFTGFPIFKVRNDGNIGAGTIIPEARLDVLTAPAAPYSQIWRDQSNVIVASVSAGGVLYADGAGLRNIAGDGLGGHTASQALNLAGNQVLNASSVTVTGAQGVGAARLALAPGVALSSAAAATQGGVYVSTHIYLPAGARYYGDGSQLSGIPAADGLGDHTLTQYLVTGNNWITGDGDPEGLYVDGSGNAGIGTGVPAARLDVLGDQGGYIQLWRNNAGVAQATMTAAGLLQAAALAAPRLALAPGVELSSSAPAFNGGVYVSSNIYVVGVASAAKYYGDGSALTGVSGSDDLGDHTLDQNLVAGSNWLSGDGGGEGVSIDPAGNVGIGVNPATARLEVNDGDASALTSGLRFTDFSCSGFDKLTVDGSGDLVCAPDQAGGISGIVSNAGQFTGDGAGAGTELTLKSSSVTLQGNSFNTASQLVMLDGTGRLPAVDGSLLTGITGSDDLGDHTATESLKLAGNAIVAVSSITVSTVTSPGAAVYIAKPVTVNGGASVSGNVTAGAGAAVSTLSATGFLSLANLPGQPAGAGSGSLYYDSTAFGGDGALYVNLNGTFVPLATGTVAGGSGTFFGIISDADQFTGDGDSTNLTLKSSSVTLRGNNFNGAGQLVLLDGSGRLPAVDGSLLTGITGGGGGALSCTNPNNPADILVQVGDLCVDKYEATVWSSVLGGTQYGVGEADYNCADDGSNCVFPSTPIYALSLAGFTPSSDITWFQASMACANSGKHLITNAEWQAAAAGTPSNGSGLPPECNFSSMSNPSNTGAGTGCLSTTGVENMVGSLWEMVAEWISDGLGGALVTQRGGGFSTGPGATTMLMESEDNPLYSDAGMGFRCAMQLR